MSEYKKIANAQAELTVTVDAESWKQAQKKAFHKLAKTVEIKGFRKGQAPENMARKALSEGRILLEAAESMAQPALEQGIKEHSVELIDRPELKIDKMDENELVLTFVCPIKPDVEIENYKGLGYHEEQAEVSDEDVDHEIDTFRSAHAELELKEDGEVEEGDTVVIDFEGFLNGEPFEGGKAENHSLEIGSHSFIPGFEEQLVGMKSEETKEIEVTFPEDYQEKSLAGQKTTFKVTVHEIKKKVMPELDRELIDELEIPDVHTAEDLKAYVKKGLTDQRQRENETKAKNELFDKLVEMAKIDVPAVMINEEVNAMVNDYERQFTYQQMGMGLTKEIRDMLMEQLRPEAEKRVRTSLIIEEIGKRENIEVTPEEVEEEYKKLAEQYHMELADIKRSLPESFLHTDLRDRKTIEILKQN